MTQYQGEERRAPVPSLGDQATQQQQDTGLVPRWIGAFVVGELVGFVAPAAVGATLGAAAVSDVVMVVGLTIAGSLEGAALGAAQAWVLRRYVPAVNGRDWTVATAVAAAFAWFVGMTGAAVLGSQPEPLWVVAVMLAPAWLAALLGMGFAQWLVLRRVVPQSRSWILATAAAWLVGVMIPVVVLSVIPDSWSMVVRAVAAVVAAITMGAVVGALTGVALRRILVRSQMPGTVPNARRD